MNDGNKNKIKKSRGCFPDNKKGQEDYEKQWDEETGVDSETRP